ncbi:MAG: shikimate dehydrogenase [Reyranella sp.]|uniref:shikimate dehydrogenase n=1 Tax=Reyranella sp. TaxID=1929291 RepID=UPI002730C18A|nr:shikimate dehydrogenase [Reyranella sp.]MDP1963036.1 shikimate dehydrogenase [Reyranella sp.]MDP2376352.1 shikimate dehydrogenase [Reyranella sp.]
MSANPNPYDQLVAEAAGRPFAAIVGWPVEHSRSPALHGFWLKQHHIAGHYGRLPVEPRRQALKELVAFLKRTPNARGCNLTLPHKIEIMPLLDRIDPGAQRIGAVNTVVKQADGTLEGRNTDGFGFLEALRYNAPHWRAEAGPVVVLGAGGAARAVVASLVDAGVPELRLVNRTRETAVDLGVALTPHDGRRIVVGSWDERADLLDGTTLLVNTTSLGMKGQPPLDIDLARLPRSAIVYDIVSVPLETALLAEARGRGNRCVDGLGMLLHQGRPGFEAWFGTKVDVSTEQRHVAAADLGA